MAEVDALPSSPSPDLFFAAGADSELYCVVVKACDQNEFRNHMGSPAQVRVLLVSRNSFFWGLGFGRGGGGWGWGWGDCVFEEGMGWDGKESMEYGGREAWEREDSEIGAWRFRDGDGLFSTE
jgi:hypothetical protein